MSNLNITQKPYDSVRHLRQAVAQKRAGMTVHVIAVESGGEPPDGTTLWYYPSVDKRRQGGQYAVQRRDSGTSFYFVEEWGEAGNPLSFSKGTKLTSEQIDEQMIQIVADLPFLREDSPSKEVPARVLELLGEMNERLEKMVVLGWHSYKPDKVYGFLKVRELSDDDLAMLPEHLVLLRNPVIEEDAAEEDQGFVNLATVPPAAPGDPQVRLAPAAPQTQATAEETPA